MGANDVAKGVALSLLGSVVKCINTIFVRYAGDNSVDVFEVLFMRSVFQIALFRLLVSFFNIPLTPPKGTRIQCIAFAFLNTASALCAYQAFSLIVPGLAISSNRAARTVFVILLSFLFTDDLFVVWDLFAVAFCLFGIGFAFAATLVFPSDGFVPSFVIQSISTEAITVNVVGFVLVTVSGIFKAISMIVIRRNKDKLHSFLLVLYQATFMMPVMFALAASFSQKQWPPTWRGTIFTVGVCMTSSIATWTSNRAVQLAPPTLVALVQNVDIAIGLLMDICFLSSMPNWLELVGAGMILIGVVSVSLTRFFGQSKKQLVSSDDVVKHELHSESLESGVESLQKQVDHI